MAKILNFFNTTVFGEQSESLLSWINSHKNNQEELRSIFLNLDCALKYVHDHGYCVANFSPTSISVLNDNARCIQFKQLIELPKDLAQREEIIRQDIFKSSFLQIAIYCNMLNSLTFQILKEKFNDLIFFLPAEDIGYYRGIIERGASVYFCEYRLEDFRRKLSSLGENNAKFNMINEIIAGNNYFNSLIYQKINNSSNAAFIHFLIIPTIIFFSLFLFSVICWSISAFSLIFN